MGCMMWLQAIDVLRKSQKKAYDLFFASGYTAVLSSSDPISPIRLLSIQSCLYQYVTFRMSRYKMGWKIKESRTLLELRCKNVIPTFRQPSCLHQGIITNTVGWLVYIVSKDTQVSVIMAKSGLISLANSQILKWHTKNSIQTKNG